MSLLLLTAKKKFSPYNWFKKGEQGAWYDPSDLTTLFQDSAGTTPVTLSPMEQPVGLMLDKSKGLALGAELKQTGVIGLVGTLATPATYNTTTGEGSINRVSYPGEQSYVSFSGLAPNSWYKFNFTALSGVVNIRIGNITVSGPNTYIPGFIYVATDATGILLISTQVNGTLTFTLASVKQIAGNHAFQSDATPGKRPLLSARVNLLTKTEDFSDVAWTTWYFTSGGGTITVSPDKKSITFYTPIGGRAFMNADLPNITDTFTYGVRRVFNISSGGYSNIVCGTTVDSGVSDGYIKVTGGGNTLRRFGIINVATVESSVTFSFPDLRPTNSGALLPAYQRVNTATDYDTVGFPLYLKCNGSSSAMSTNSINFTATDKMTVVTGVRKLGQGPLLELGTNGGLVNGSFYIWPGAFTAGDYIFCVTGTANATIGTTPYTAPISNVLSFGASISTPNAFIKVDGITKAATTASLGTGNFSNLPLNLFFRAAGSFYSPHNFYGAIIRGAQSDTNSVVQTENYMAKQTGITF